MSTELGRLTAVFDANTRGFDAGLRHMDRGIETTTTRAQRFSHALNNALNSISPRLGGEINQISGSLSTAASTANFFGGAIGIAGIAVTAFTVIVGGAAKQIYELATNAAATTDRVGDMAEKINFSVRTLSGLEPAAEAAGSSLEGLSTALGIFDRNIEAAAQGQERLSKLFKGLKIDTTNNEAAFRQVAAVLVKLDGTAQQTALAMELFGRSGKDVLGIVKAADGDVEKFIKSMEALGIVINDDAVKAADEFDKKLILVKAQINTVIRQLGEEFIPMVSEAAGNLSDWLKRNQGEIRKTINEIGNLVKAIGGLAEYINMLSPITLTITIVRRLMPDQGTITTEQQQRNVFTQDPVTGRRIYSGNAPYDTPGEFAIAGGAGQYSTGAGAPAAPQANALADQVRNLLRRGGGGGGGGGGTDPAQTAKRIAEMQLRAVLDGLQAEQEANRRSLDLRRKDFNSYATQYMVIENRRHEAVIAGLDKEQKAAEKLKKGSEVALLDIQNRRTAENTTHEQNRNRVLDERARILDQIDRFLLEQDRSVDALTRSTDQWDQAYQGLVDTLKEEGVTLEDNTRKRIEANIERAKELELILSVTRARRVADQTRDRFVTREGRARPPWIDLGGGSTVGGEPGTTTRERVVTADLAGMRDQMARIRERLRDLGYELTDVFGHSIADGFDRGIKSGLQTLSVGLLRIVEDVFLRKLAEGLSNILSSIGTSGGGGNWFTKLISPILGIVAGGIGGGTSGGVGSALAGAIGRDAGGPIWPDTLYKVHKDEYIMPTGPGYVIPKSGIGGQTVIKNYTINLPPDSRGSYSSPRSKRQLSETLIAALQATQP